MQNRPSPIGNAFSQRRLTCHVLLRIDSPEKTRPQSELHPTKCTWFDEKGIGDTILIVKKLARNLDLSVRRLCALWLVFQLFVVVGNPACGIQLASASLPAQLAVSAIHAPEHPTNAAVDPCLQETQLASAGTGSHTALLTLQVDAPSDRGVVIQRVDVGAALAAMPAAHTALLAVLEPPPIPSL
jgi:hypothetical protein